MAINSFTAQAQAAADQYAEEKWHERLISMGMTEDQAIEAGLSLLSQEETVQEIGFSKGSATIKIKYPGSKFCRYRFLGQFIGNKYHQLQGTEPEVYCPPEVIPTLSNPSVPLIITEGEFKALSCKIIPTVALGGINSTCRLHENNKVLLDPLNRLPPGKIVYIAFDYDPAPPFNGEPKLEVASAEIKLATMLTLRNCIVKFIRLGEPDMQVKMGLDDFLEVGYNLLNKMKSAKLFKPTKNDGLDFLLSNYATYQGDIIDVNRLDVYTKHKFMTQEANCKNPYQENPPDKEPTPVAKFLSDSYRTTVTGFTFDPSTSSVMSSDYELNTWRGIKTRYHHGFTTDPDKKAEILEKVKLWTEFLDLFFTDDQVVRPYFEECMALALQKPYIKQERVLVLMSPHEGIGKSFYFETIAAIFNNTEKGMPLGKFNHALVTSGNDLGDNFNSLLADKKLIVFNEIGEKGEKHTNLIKDLTTSRSITVNEKYVKARSVPNYLQLCITTNESYTHIVDKQARREAIYKIAASSSLGPRLKEFFAKNNELKTWVNTPEARTALYDYYLNYDIGEYNGTQPAPENESKDTIAEAISHDAVIYIEEELHDVLYIIPKLEYMLYLEDGHNRAMSKSMFGTYLKNAGFAKGKWDVTLSQLSLQKYTDNKQLQRPCVLVNSKKAPAYNPDDRGDIFEYLVNRYYPGQAFKR